MWAISPPPALRCFSGLLKQVCHPPGSRQTIGCQPGQLIYCPEDNAWNKGVAWEYHGVMAGGSARPYSSRPISRGHDHPALIRTARHSSHLHDIILTIQFSHRNRYMSMPPPRFVRILLLILLPLLPVSAPHAENVAPGPHWGAIDFPDRNPVVLAGFTVNRFTEFTPSRDRFNAVDETAGFNFATISWTDRIKALPGWSGNLTLGAGPTRETPSRELQNNFAHRALGNSPIPITRTRHDGDGMAGGSLTRWSTLFSSRDTGFAGMGIAGGSLYQEIYGRIGLRHLSLTELAAWLFPGSDPALLRSVSRYVRFSAMGRYSRLYGGSAYSGDVIADHNYLGQASVSLADYGLGDGPAPRWAVEVALTYDSGLFVSPNGRWLTRRFGSVALHFPFGTFETWNDWVGSTDSGPTYGFSLMLNVRELSSLFASL